MKKRNILFLNLNSIVNKKKSILTLICLNVLLLYSQEKKEVEYVRIVQYEYTSSYKIILEMKKKSIVLSKNEFLKKRNRQRKIKRFKLNTTQYSSLQSSFIPILKLNPRYDSPMLDGVYWKIEAVVSGQKVNVLINNYCVPEVDSFIRKVKELIDCDKYLMYTCDSFFPIQAPK